MGKAIYMPKGKAGEYAKYAVNFYVGCSNDCAYCYCKRGVLAHAMGAPVATLKKCFKDEADAMRVFKKELHANIDELRKYGLFFTFTSDPFIAECKEMTYAAVDYAIHQGVPCQMLTKRADFDPLKGWEDYKHLLAFGFTLTGFDNLEAKASSNEDRIRTMRYLALKGYKTFASIEPVIDLDWSLAMISDSIDCCYLYKIGLVSGKRMYEPIEVEQFMKDVHHIIFNAHEKVMVYWKDSVLDFTKTSREELAVLNEMSGIIADADYNLFEN